MTVTQDKTSSTSPVIPDRTTMNMLEMNEALRNLYLEYVDEMYKNTWDEGISSPLLMNVPDEYQLMKRKILFVGQETHSWMGKMNDKREVETLQTDYKGFDLGKKVIYGKKDFPRQLNSQFWNFIRNYFLGVNLRTDTTISKKTSGFLWTNISKFDYNGGTPTTHQKSNNTLGFSLLKKEVEIERPDIIVFLIGKKYDQDLAKQFCFKENENFKSDYLSILTEEKVKDPILIFKTFHPTYLCRSGKNREVLKQMINMTNGIVG